MEYLGCNGIYLMGYNDYIYIMGFIWLNYHISLTLNSSAIKGDDFLRINHGSSVYLDLWRKVPRFVNEQVLAITGAVGDCPTCHVCEYYRVSEFI